ncbi:MAG: sensor histidine kinase [Planctomycetota bacterium]
MPLPGRSLSAQLVWPVVGLVLAAVLANVAFTTWLATRAAVVAARDGRQRVVAALDRSRIALTPAVVDALADLTGSQFVVWDDDEGRAVTTSIGPVDDAALAETLGSVGAGDVVTVAGRGYAVGVVHARGVRPERAFVLAPVRSFAATIWSAAWPVLAVAAATLAVLVPVGLATTGRIARRIGLIERRVERFSEGDFAADGSGGHAFETDEVGRLSAGVERMRMELESLRTRLVAGERQRLLGQLAAGFAHELRNAITGAKLAIDLHRRRCQPGGSTHQGSTSDESLAVASRQLDIVEEEVRGLLTLGTPPPTAPAPVDLDRLVGEVRDLVGPRAAHAGVTVAGSPSCRVEVSGRRDGLRAALVNLALNAIDAAGDRGRVTVAAESIPSGVALVVEDDGPGPPAALAESLHEPFVTGKREGVGLGLAVAKAVAEQHGGTLAWSRTAGRTRFEIRIPATSPIPAEPVA